MAERLPTAAENMEYKNKNGDQRTLRTHMECRSSQPEAMKLHDATLFMQQPINDTLSILPGGNIYETHGVLGNVTELTSVLAGDLTSGDHVVPINSAVEPEGDDGLRINIDQPINVPTHESAKQLIARVLGTVGLLTLVMDVRTALYKPPSGVVFGHNKLAYYVTLTIIFVFGVGEIFTAFWISCSDGTRRRFWIWGFVLLLSIWALVCILGIGGFA